MIKRDVKTGNVVPIYFDRMSIKFRGMGELVGQDHSTEPQHFIFNEKDKRDKQESPKVGDSVYYRINNKMNTFEINNLDNDRVILKDLITNALISVDNLNDVKPVLDQMSEIIIDDVHYIVYRDYENYTEVFTQKDFSENNVHLAIRFDKPYEYRMNFKSPQSYIHRSERWRVHMLDNPFYGELNVGDKVFYKDICSTKVQDKTKDGILIYHKNKYIIANTLDLFIPYRYKLLTFAYITYKLKVSSRHYERILSQGTNDSVIINSEFD